MSEKQIAAFVICNMWIMGSVITTRKQGEYFCLVMVGVWLVLGFFL